MDQVLSKKNIVLVILIIAIASSVSVISYQYSLSTSQQIEALSAQDVRSNADIQAYDLTNSFSSKLGDIISILQVVSGAPAVLQGDVERAKIILNQADDSTSELIDFYLWLDADGKLVWVSRINQTTYEQYRGTDLSYRLYFTTARDTGQVYYSSVIDSNDRINRLYISIPILDNITSSSNQFKGVVAAGIRSDLLGGFLERQVSPNLESEVVLLDNTGIILYSKDIEYVGKNVFGVRFQSFLASQDVNALREMNSGFKAALAGDSGLVDIALDGKVATFVYKPIIIEGKQFGVLYIVASHEYASSVSSLIEQQKNFSMLLIVLTATAAIGIIFVILSWNRRLENVVATKTAELKQANEQLEMHDKMQKEFINIAAHELRTPVQPILGMAEILEGEFGNKRDDIRIITRNARRLERLTQDILDVTRIESQSLNLTTEKFDLGELIDTLVQDYRKRLLNGDGTELEYRQMEESLIIEGDKERLSQVITNFVDNALRFTKNGRVSVTAGREPDGGMSVSVTDTGIGIDADMLPRLFTKFASKGERGTGLGLFIARSIIEAHGGKIWGTNNADGKGATFAFTIPPRR